ncbi:MAG: hypothetical protein JWM63_2002 [Gammaproteobacteria bacterium]|jgi:hypothetical protein|nr:hypothetical protein [Gammaproteobacteria bacterium]
MNIRVVLFTAACGALCGGMSPVSWAQGAPEGAAQSAPKTSPAASQPAASTSGAAYPKGHYASLDVLPDWGGVWVLNRPGKDAPAPEQPSPKGKYLAGYDAWRREVKAKDGEVPHEGSYCTPPGMPGIMGVGQYPMEFLFTPGRVTTHHEAWMQWRNIYTDGRGHPDDLDPTFEGHSIGHWEHGTLIVDTVGIKDSVALAMGMKHSDQLRIGERIHLAQGDPDTLVVEMTVADPAALTKPWIHTLTYKRSRDWELLEFVCAENDRNPVDASGKTGFKTQ